MTSKNKQEQGTTDKRQPIFRMKIASNLIKGTMKKTDTISMKIQPKNIV